MIRQLIKRVLGRGKKLAANEPKVLPQKAHGIRRADISSAALRTCEGLHDAGFKAFVVGGAVRDLLLGRHPKDFDVATDATPEQVRQVFRRSRIIGRRFRIVHVMFGNETIEVTTFRAAAGVPESTSEDQESDGSSETIHLPAETDSPEEGRNNGRRRRRPWTPETTQTTEADEHGRLLRDNVFGSQADDALRRDFTMNALFYDPAREEVWDYVNGVDDVRKKRVVIIGDPIARYREDPVRMLRAARLAGKLDFSLDAATEKPIGELSSLLENVPKARLFDELLKLLLSGHAERSIERLHALGLHRQVLPVVDHLLHDPASRPFIQLALRRTDERINADKGVSPAFLFAALFWFPMQTRRHAIEASGVPTVPAWHDAMTETLDEQRKNLAIPRRLDPLIKEIWIAQPRFLQRSKDKAMRVLGLPRFRACYDFFELRSLVGDADPTIAKWWHDFQFADDEIRAGMLLPDDAPRKKRRRKRKPAGHKPAAPVAPNDHDSP